MNKPDYELKSKVLKNDDLIRTQKLISKSLYKQSDVLDYKTGQYLSYDDALELHNELRFDKEYQEAIKINNCSYKRAIRLEDRIKSFLIKGNCIFVTLTFDDDTLRSTSADTRKTYVRRYLKSQSDYYVANIDYGGKNGREHYHAVLVCDNADNTSWRYGLINFKRVNADINSPKRLSKYVSKLTNHAIKETTKRNHIIYSLIN